MSVRRPQLIDHLAAFGADVTLVDGPDLRARVTEATGGGRIKLGIDAIAGEATRRLASCLADGGTVVNYGLLSGKPCEVDAADIVFRDISLRGFWYSRWLASASRPRSNPSSSASSACCRRRRCGCRSKPAIRSKGSPKRWRMRSARGGRAKSCCGGLPRERAAHLKACGLIGEPEPPVMMSGGAVKRNS